jgi:hypothetical protein
MMHDRGKSDFAIVAVKPTNNAGQPAAEPAEPTATTTAALSCRDLNEAIADPGAVIPTQDRSLGDRQSLSPMAGNRFSILAWSPPRPDLRDTRPH